jgi:dihydrofolate reductase
MGQVKVAGFALSLDGFGAGIGQSLDAPMGVGGRGLHQWFFGTRTFRAMIGAEGGSDGIDERFAHASMSGFGAFILGRNMFSPDRGDWPDPDWRGWWGDNPPYHAPTFILTHYPRPSIEMAGGTTFHFVTDGIHAALDRAREVAGDHDIKIGGGVATVRQFLEARLIDTLHLAIAPVLLGQGEALFAGLDLPALGYHVTERVPSELATHVVIERSEAA